MVKASTEARERAPVSQLPAAHSESSPLGEHTYSYLTREVFRVICRQCAQMRCLGKPEKAEDAPPADRDDDDPEDAEDGADDDDEDDGEEADDEWERGEGHDDARSDRRQPSLTVALLMAAGVQPSLRRYAASRQRQGSWQVHSPVRSPRMLSLLP